METNWKFDRDKRGRLRITRFKNGKWRWTMAGGRWWRFPRRVFTLERRTR